MSRRTEHLTKDKDGSELSAKQTCGFGFDSLTLGIQQDGDWCGILLNKQQILDLARFLHEQALEMIHDGEAMCQMPPLGWYCTRQAGHEGPCAAWPTK